jgi:hypothetical protein
MRGVYDRGVARWNELHRYEGPWIDVFVLMWEAYEAGTIPVGAVIAARRAEWSRFASTDAYGGAVGKLLPSRDHAAHPMNVAGPLEGPAGPLPEALLVAHCLWRRPKGDVVRFYREQRPDLVQLAETLPAPASGGTLPAVYAAAAAACR